LICEYLEAIAAGKLKQLLINIPPRHLKSRLVSVVYPCWRWLTAPHVRFLCMSYAGSLANDHNYDRRRLIESDWYQELAGGLPLLLGKNRITEFGNAFQGAMIARGLDAAVTGVGGDELIFDDPNNPESVESDIVREGALRRFKAYSTDRRNTPDAPVIVIQQRTHVHDVSGYILKEGLDYAVLRLPTEAEESEVIRFPLSGRTVARSPGELLHPERVNTKGAAEIKAALGSYLWAARHQQRPVPLGGGLIKEKWIPRFDEPLFRYEQVIQSWDTANKKGVANCPWSCTTWGISNGVADLLHAYTQRHDYPDGKRAVANLYRQWQPQAVLIEDKSSGISLIQDCRSPEGLDGAQVPAIAIQPEGDKITRMSTEAPLIEAGRVRFPQSAPWLPDFEAVIFNYPNSAINDPVDSLSQFLKWWRMRSQTVTVTAAPYTSAHPYSSIF